MSMSEKIVSPVPKAATAKKPAKSVWEPPFAAAADKAVITRLANLTKVVNAPVVEPHHDYSHFSMTNGDVLSNALDLHTGIENGEQVHPANIDPESAMKAMSSISKGNAAINEAFNRHRSNDGSGALAKLTEAAGHHTTAAQIIVKNSHNKNLIHTQVLDLSMGSAQDTPENYAKSLN